MNPTLMTPLDMQFNNFELGVDYPHPIVDIKENRKKASEDSLEFKERIHRYDPKVLESSKNIRSPTETDSSEAIR